MTKTVNTSTIMPTCKILKLTFILPVLFGAIVPSCNDTPKKQTDASAVAKNDSVKVFILKSVKVEKQTVLPGELFPYEQVDIRAKVPGYIRQIKVDIGSVVKKGQPLVVIDAPEVESRLDEAGSKMDAARAKYEASKDMYDRVLIASKSDGVIAPTELQRAKNQMLADSAEYIAATFSSKSSKQIGNYLVIVAPFNGVVTERNVHEGAYVGTPNERPILVVQNNSTLRLRVAVPEALTAVQLKDNKIRFSTKANPDQLFEASLTRQAPNINTDTRSEVWEFEIKNDKNKLTPGSFADVRLDVSRNQPSFLVPYSAVVTTLEKKFVIRVSHDTTQWVDILPGLNLSDKTEVFGKLNEGDSIVVKSSEELKSGTHVIPTK